MLRHYKGKEEVRERGYCSQFQLANCSRRASFLNLPTEVRGMASRKTKASGSCHLANVSARKARNSSGVACAPSLRTTAASGRSCHFGCGMPTTQASFTAGCPLSVFFKYTGLIPFPPLLSWVFWPPPHFFFPSPPLV